MLNKKVLSVGEFAHACVRTRNLTFISFSNPSDSHEVSTLNTVGAYSHRGPIVSVSDVHRQKRDGNGETKVSV